MPLVITHGWPGSVTEFVKIIETKRHKIEPRFEKFHQGLQRGIADASEQEIALYRPQLAALGVPQPSHKVLIVDAKDNGALVAGARNLSSSQWLAPEGVNVYDILRHQTLVLTQAAVQSLTAALTEGAK